MPTAARRGRIEEDEDEEFEVDEDDLHSDEENHDTHPTGAHRKAGNAAGGRRGKSGQSKSNNRHALAEKSNTPDGDGPFQVEQVYQKKSQLEHILLRPDTYVGSTEKVSQTLYVPETSEDNQPVMAQQQVSFVPGLYKIFDEVLVNAADNKVRDPKGMKEVRVHIDQRAGTVSVFNDGRGIDVEVHKEEGVYVPELIFGHLLTSSNYNDSERKVTGGRNGFGAKLANIFSSEFIVETADGSRKRQYKQVFNDNMQRTHKPSITSCKAADNWTKITFQPDLKRFQMEHLEDDVVQLMSKRVYDIAGTIGKDTKVYLNNRRIPVKGFSEYVDLFLRDKPDCPKIYERMNDRWEVCISASEGQMQNVSFVNSINTARGGSHVTYIADQVANKVLEKMSKKDKANLKPLHVKNNLFIFVNCLIENPAFDSQTKETLTTRQNAFGSKCEIGEKMVNSILKSQIKENIIALASQKQSKELKKSDGKKRNRLSGIPKLDDANDAGTKKSEECTLILTEGDSAKALAVAGLSVLGRDKFGVFPLRGKLLNVRDASHQQVMNNQEITNLKQILGLQQGRTYSDAKSLRYGHVMIMTDQDHDGSHIKGLLINFFHHFFPSLLKLRGFLLEFITPIVKASKGRQKKVFYSMPEYEEWRNSLGNSTQGWSVKYYKGLGTSTSAEAKEYFAALTDHRKIFKYNGEDDDKAITMAFSKKKAEERKEWMNNHIASTFLDQNTREINYADFINKELILFSLADLQRSIPSLLDGLKTSQRKVLYGAFKKKLKSEIKVAQLSGYVSEHSAYHHGEASLAATIVSLAQDFVGSNNINLLHPAGQFGTRLQGGKDHASSRYIFTKMGPLTRNLFMESDERLLKYQYDDGQRIEPEYYLPILPLSLINGCEGIGTGWSTNIPNYSPRDVAMNIKRLINEEEPLEMTPWYRGFKGTIEKKQSNSRGASRGETFEACGIINQIDATTLEITELPIRYWTQDYKEFLESLVKPADGGEPQVQEYKEYHTDTNVHFVLSLSDEQMKAALNEGLYKRFRMTTKLSTSNMHLFNEDGTITKYTTPSEVLHAFFNVRMQAYTKRRELLIDHAKQNLKRATNKVRFIQEVVDGQRTIARKRKDVLEAELERDGFDKLPKNANTLAMDDNDDDDSDSSNKNVGYDYLLSMALWTLTKEKIEELEQQKQDDARKLAMLEETSASSLWEEDINNFLEALDAHEKEENAAAARQRKAPAKNARLKKQESADGDDDEDFVIGGTGSKQQAKQTGGRNKQQPKASQRSTQKKDDSRDNDMMGSRANEEGEHSSLDTDGVGNWSKMDVDNRYSGSKGQNKKASVRPASERNKPPHTSGSEENEDSNSASTTGGNDTRARVKTVGVQRKATAGSNGKKTQKKHATIEEEEEEFEDYSAEEEDDDAFEFGSGPVGGPVIASQTSEARQTRGSNKQTLGMQKQQLGRLDSDDDEDQSDDGKDDVEEDDDDDDDDFVVEDDNRTDAEKPAKQKNSSGNDKKAPQKKQGATTAATKQTTLSAKNDSNAKANAQTDDDDPGSLLDRMAARFSKAKSAEEQAGDEARSPGKTKRTGMNEQGGASDDVVVVDDRSPGPEMSPAYPPKKRRAL